MKTNMKTLGFALLTAALFGLSPSASAQGAVATEPAEVVGLDFSNAKFNCELAEFFDASASSADMTVCDLLEFDALSVLRLYQHVYPDGKYDRYDCTYNKRTNTSVEVERWIVHVEVGTEDRNGVKNPIVNSNVLYYYAKAVSGNTC